MKVLVALRVPDANVPAIIQAHRRYLVQLMQQWTRIKDEPDAGDLSLGLAVDAEIFRLDSVIRWLDAADSRIKRVAAAQETAAADRAAPGQPQWALPRLRTRVRTAR